MQRRTVHEIDIRHWIPALSLAMLVFVTLVWGTIDYHDRRAQVEARALDGWHRSMLRIQNLLETGVQGGPETARMDGLFTLFNDTPGLRYLATIETSARIISANRRGLLGQSAQTALPGFDLQALRTDRLATQTGSVRLDRVPG